jgi:hypothetical protein
MLALAGVAYDPEDAELDDAALIWTSDRDGQLGSGALLTLAAQDLALGPQRITLRATDRDGMDGSATVCVSVGRGLYLPLIMKGYGR